MGFTLDPASRQEGGDIAGLDDNQEILLFGRAIEIDDLDQVYHYQLSLPLLFPKEPVRYVQ